MQCSILPFQILNPGDSKMIRSYIVLAALAFVLASCGKEEGTVVSRQTNQTSGIVKPGDQTPIAVGSGQPGRGGLANPGNQTPIAITPKGT